MFEDGQLYSPVSRGDDGEVQVHLAENHPGFADPDYRRRRNEIADAALRREPGGPVPTIDYTEEEHGIWRQVCAELGPQHARHASREYLAAKERLGLPTDRVPQLDEVTARLQPLTGFRYVSAPGLVELREFYGSLADAEFHSTQYLRHPSMPLYTPEPDIIHEVVGHANQLASPRFAALTRAAGTAVRRLETDEAVQLVADVFWFTLEFGVVREDGDLKAYGAGILSSYGELDEYARMEIRPLDLASMGTLNYDITSYQPVLFAADSLDQLEDVVGVFFTEVDDDRAAALHRSGLAAAGRV
ncbi:phenylalanine 4-monooxygenase [Desertihabitans aurantiacus]|uniref:phenylalanine 4-monooxygenase n=1 Tax=Desertihabitans aurantiacus TaxID=2282477 RepID=UPI000DF7CFDD|nr:phenylalanine 4-monooxygenase [Desertihabitans aurantiacus]